MGEVVGTRQRVTQYIVSALPEDICVDAFAWDVAVEWRGGDQWAVKHGGSCLNDREEWDFMEPIPSSRTDAYKSHHRFTENEALRLAHKVAPTIVVNGYSVQDIIDKYAEDDDCAWSASATRRIVADEAWEGRKRTTQTGAKRDHEEAEARPEDLRHHPARRGRSG